MIRVFQLVAAPCRHDLAGRPHKSLSSAYWCVVRNGNPGVERRLVEIGPARSK